MGRRAAAAALIVAPCWADGGGEGAALPPEESCVDHCGSWAESCWCNEKCDQQDNWLWGCCADYAAVCGGGGGGGGSCPRVGGRCGDYSCDEWIRWKPSEYTCQSLEERWGCDCTGCKECGGPAPKPAGTAALRLLPESDYPEARCLDGSQAGYYLREGSSTHFQVYLEGGGWCYDQDCANPTVEGTLRDCRDRAKGRLGSSRSWAHTNDWLTGSLSADPKENPVFHNWTLVWVPYCDGMSFSGDAVVDGVHFKGRAILSAVIADLKARTAIGDASQVVLGGGSAGASAVFYHVDKVAEELALSHGEVVGLPDAGFFLDLKDRSGIDCWPAQMRSVFEVGNGTRSLNERCLARYPEEQSKCLFPEYFPDLIESRMFVINSFYDSSETYYTLRLSCCPGGCGGKYPACSGRDMYLFGAMRQQHMAGWAPLVNRTGNGVWAVACPTHTMAWDHWTDPEWEVPARSGYTMASAVGEWLSGAERERSYVHQDEVAFPDNAPCSGQHTGFSEVI